MARPSRSATYSSLLLLLFSGAPAPASSFLAGGRRRSPLLVSHPTLPASQVLVAAQRNTDIYMAPNEENTAAMTGANDVRSARTKDTSPGAIKARRLYTWPDARRKARTYGFTSRQEFVEYECAGSYQLPKNSDEVWADEWTNWEDFLGVPPKFEEARAVASTMARDMGVRTEEAYLEVKTGDAISDDDVASRLPLRPDLYYKTDWTSWDDFLGL